MNFLSLNSATNSPSVSVFINNNHVDTVISESKSSSILPSITNEILIKNNLKISDLDYIAITIGPGSFTGLRVGLSLAQGLSYSGSLSIAPVNLLDVFISKINSNDNALVAFHSHGDFIFSKHIKNDTTRLININDIIGDEVYGMGLDKFKDTINYNELNCSSKDIGEYAIENYEQIISDDIGSIMPIYLNEYKVDSSI